MTVFRVLPSFSNMFLLTKTQESSRYIFWSLNGYCNLCQVGNHLQLLLQLWTSRETVSQECFSIKKKRASLWVSSQVDAILVLHSSQLPLQNTLHSRQVSGMPWSTAFGSQLNHRKMRADKPKRAPSRYCVGIKNKMDLNVFPVSAPLLAFPIYSNLLIAQDQFFSFY